MHGHAGVQPDACPCVCSLSFCRHKGDVVAFMTYFCRLSGLVICLSVSMLCAKVKLSAMPNQDVSPEVIHLWRSCRRRCCPVP